MQTNTFKVLPLPTSSVCKVVAHGAQLVTTVGVRSVSAHLASPIGAFSEAAMVGAAVDAVRLGADAAVQDVLAWLDPELVGVQTAEHADLAIAGAETRLAALVSNAVLEDDGALTARARNAALAYAAAVLLRHGVAL